MEAANDRLRTAYRMVVIIGMAMMGSVLIYVVVAEFLRGSQPPWNAMKGILFSAGDPTFDYIKYALLAVGIVSALLVVKISSAVNLSPDKLTNPTPALMTHSVIVFAACEAVAILGLVVFFLAGNITDMYIFAAVSLGLFAIFFPRYSRWSQLAESRLGAPTFE